MTGVFRIRFSVAGSHIHCRLFYATAHGQTFAKCGAFVVRRGQEFIDLVDAFKAEIVGETGDDTLTDAMALK